MDKARGWLLIGGVLAIVAAAGFAAVGAVRQATEEALAPVSQVGEDIESMRGKIEQFSDEVATQVSRVVNPTPTVLPDPVTIVHEVRSLARLETIQYSMEKIIRIEVGHDITVFGILFGDKMLFVGHGEVIAGVDLEKLSPQDLWVEEGVLYVRLPEAEIFVTRLDNEKSYVYDREKGMLTKGNDELETEARQAAEAEILTAALEDGILEQARINAENFLFRLLRDLGYPAVNFVGGTAEP